MYVNLEAAVLDAARRRKMNNKGGNRDLSRVSDDQGHSSDSIVWKSMENHKVISYEIANRESTNPIEFDPDIKY